MDYIVRLLKDYEDQKEFRICIESKRNSFNLILLQESNAWTAEVTPKDLENLGQQFNMTIIPYFLSVQDYLANLSPNVKFKLTENEFSIYRIAGDNMNVKYFSCKLEKENHNKIVYDLLDHFYLKGTEFSKILVKTNRDRNELANSKELLERKLKEYVEYKKSDDQELYNSFLMVLNEKKRRILHLNELLEAFRSGRPRINPHVEVKNRKSKKSESKLSLASKIEISDSTSENSIVDDYDTDEEISSKQLEERFNENIPNISKSTHDFLDDSFICQSLPKRTRRMEIINYSSMPSTSAAISSLPKEKASKTDLVEEYQGTVDFSTQELLDHI